MEFRTYNDAFDAGYTKATPHNGKNISGPNSFGYAFARADGVESISVYFTEGKNRMGSHGCVIPMYPPGRATNPM